MGSIPLLCDIDNLKTVITASLLGILYELNSSKKTDKLAVF